MDYKIIKIENSKFSLIEIYNFIRKVYADRVAEGINFTLMQTSYEDYEKKVINNHKQIFIAIDNDRIVGTSALTIFKNNNNISAGFSNLAVDPLYQGKGIATELFKIMEEEAKKGNCSYMESTTAENAYSSINLQLKQGCKKCGYYSAKDTNFYSIKFRKDFYNNKSQFYYIKYLQEKIKTKLLKNRNGEYRGLGLILYKLYHLI